MLAEFHPASEIPKNSLELSLQKLEELVIRSPFSFDEADRLIDFIEERKLFLQKQGFVPRVRSLIERMTNMWIRTRLEHVLKQPLDDWPIYLKRKLITHEWANLQLEFVVEGPLPPALSDQKVEELFRLYRSSHPDYFSWLEREELYGIFTQRSLYFKDSYRSPSSFFTQELALDKSPEAVLQKQRSLTPFCFTKLASDYGVIYQPDFHFKHVFPLQFSAEHTQQTLTKQYGDLPHVVLPALLFYLAEPKDFFYHYFRLRSNLSVSLRNQLDAFFPSPLPPSFDRHFELMSEYEQVVTSPDSPLLAPFVSALTPQTVQHIEGLICEEWEQFQHTFRSTHEDSVVMKDKLTACLRACFTYNIVGRKHYSYLMVFSMLDRLPSSLVERFFVQFPQLTIFFGPELHRLRSCVADEQYYQIPDAEIQRIYTKFSPWEDDIKTWLATEIAQLISHLDDQLPEPKLVSPTDLFAQEFEGTELSKEQLLRLQKDYQLLMSLSYRRHIEQAFSFRLEDFTFREQVFFLQFIRSADAHQVERVRSVLTTYGRDGLRAFLSIEYGTHLGLGDHILDLAEQGDSDYVKQVFASFGNLATYSQQESVHLCQGLQHAFPHIPITSHEVFQRLMQRGRDLILSASRSANSVPHLQRVLEEFVSESKEQKVMRSQFINVARLLDAHHIHLHTYAKDARVSLEAIREKGELPLFLRALQTLGRLKPIPEIHWRVDRSLKEYDRRLGIDIRAFLSDFAEKDTSKVLLELGAGSGMSKRERAFSDFSEHYQDFALSDQCYFSLQRVFEQAIDFEKLAQEIGVVFSSKERECLAEFVSKTAVIQQGETERDHFAYDSYFMQQVSDHVNAIEHLLPALQEKLRHVRMVPSTISTRDEAGRVVYPYKVRIEEQSTSVQLALSRLRTSLVSYLKSPLSGRDWFAFVDAFPSGTMLGYFSDIGKFAPEQVDVAFAVRATVYERGEGWMSYLTHIAHLLKEGGIVLDDSIRDNDGWYYRLAEFSTFLREHASSDIQAFIVLGPGFPGEDFRQDGAVPLAFVLGKQVDIKAKITPFLLDGFTLVSVDELLDLQHRDRLRYIGSLDKTGRTLDMVKTVQKATAA